MRAAHPRSRGEHGFYHRIHSRVVGSSPLARGTWPADSCVLPSIRLIPARAGNIRILRGRGRCSSAHPRSRGEHAARRVSSLGTPGSSPLARGTSKKRRLPAVTPRLIPARAGNMEVVQTEVVLAPAHPRSRGEHAHMKTRYAPGFGSSPLARGTFMGFLMMTARPRLIPARAGNISTQLCR